MEARVWIWFSYIWYYIESGQYQKTIDEANRFIKVEKSPHPAVYSNMAFAYYKLNKLDTAMRLVNRSIDGFSSNAYAYKNRALIHIANGDIDEACKDLQTAVDYGFAKQFGDEVEKLTIEHCNKM